MLVNVGIDIVALQEPAIDFQGYTVASRDWILLHPSTHIKDQKKTCMVMLISRSLPIENWE